MSMLLKSFLPSKENTSKGEICQLFSIFLGHFCSLGSGSGLGYGSRIPNKPISGYGSTALLKRELFTMSVAGIFFLDFLTSQHELFGK
jgi:hypothetical protein